MSTLSEWWKGVANKDAIIERIFQMNTLTAFLVGGSALGIWGYYPEKFQVYAGALLFVYSIYNIGANKK